MENLWDAYLKNETTATKKTKRKQNPQTPYFSLADQLKSTLQEEDQIQSLYLIKGNCLLYNSLFYCQREY